MGIINLIILHKSMKLYASCRKNFQVPKNKKRSIPLLILINLKKDMKAIACTPTAKLAISSQESPHAILLFSCPNAGLWNALSHGWKTSEG